MNLSIRVYGWLLLAYPPQFRREFGNQMIQVFRDSYRAEARSGSVPSFWLRTLLDLILTAAKERADRLGTKGIFMNRRSDTMALLVAIGIIIIAVVIQRWAMRNNVAFLLLFGYFLDALIVSGVIGNLIVFLLNKTTKLNPSRTAISVFAAVDAALLLLIVVLSSAAPVNWIGVLVGYLVSYVIWVGLHLAWRTTNRNQLHLG